MIAQPVSFSDMPDLVGPLSSSDADSDSDTVPTEAKAPLAPTTPKTGRPQLNRRRERSEASEDAAGSSDDSQVPQIDREELRWAEKVGAGITADVFRGEWKGHTVAIKQLTFTKRTAMLVKQQVAFSRETMVAARVRHKNLVQFYGVSFEKQPYLMITEFMSGGTVFDVLHCDDTVELEWNQQLMMCSDVASAMDYLHKFKPQIIHRDLKSLNLLLSEKITSPKDVPLVKVSDFGLAKMRDNEDWGKMTVAAGTFHWMAPEVQTGRYDEKADVYSYAMVLYEIICCEVPFDDLEPAEVPEAVGKGARPDLECVPEDCPEKLLELMILCWNADPGCRPSFAQISIHLNAISAAISSRPSSRS